MSKNSKTVDITIWVEGGCVTDVACSNEDFEYTIIDQDVLDAEGEEE